MFSSLCDSGGPVVHKRPFLLTKTAGLTRVELAIGWQAGRWTHDIRGFCNFRETQGDGMDRHGIAEGLRLVFGQAPLGEVYGGMVCALHVTLLGPEFGDPTKHRLDSPEALWLIADVIGEQLPAQLAEFPELFAELKARVPNRP